MANQYAEIILKKQHDIRTMGWTAGWAGMVLQIKYCWGPVHMICTDVIMAICLLSEIKIMVGRITRRITSFQLMDFLFHVKN